jgi:plasmid maintenance system antidote protein VapI
MDNQTIHLGNMIKRELKAQGRSVSWLARTINMERSSIYKIFDRDSLDVGLLIRISIVMDHDFFLDVSKKMRDHYDDIIQMYLNFQ